MVFPHLEEIGSLDYSYIIWVRIVQILCTFSFLFCGEIIVRELTFVITGISEEAIYITMISLPFCHGFITYLWGIGREI